MYDSKLIVKEAKPNNKVFDTIKKLKALFFIKDFYNEIMEKKPEKARKK